MLKIDRPILLTMPNGDTRIAEAAFLHPQGACFVDLWWDCPESMPFHILDGELRYAKDGSATIGAYSLRTLNEFDEGWDEWQRWLDYRNSDGGSHLTDEMVIAAAARDGAIID